MSAIFSVGSAQYLHKMEWRISFVTDKEELKPGLIIFRRADVQHRNWYCRIKLPKADRYKTVSLKTASASDAREIAFDKYSEMRYAIKMGVPIFNRAFSEVAKEYIAEQARRVARGEISLERVKKNPISRECAV